MTQNIDWDNQSAIKELINLTEIFGKPSIVAPEKNGLAMWTKDDLKEKELYGNKNCFHEIIIRDESIEHFCPKKHIDFLYSSVEVAVRPNQVPILFAVSGSVSYDALKNLVIARCASIEANIATLNLVTNLLLEKEINYEEKDIKYHDIHSVHQTGSYGKTIMATSDKDFTQKIHKDLCENVQKLSVNLNKGFWRGAFSYVDDKCLPPDKPDKAHLPAPKPKTATGGPEHKTHESMNGGVYDKYRPDKPHLSINGGVYKQKYQKSKKEYLNLKNNLI